MIIITHKNNKVTQVLDANKQSITSAELNKPITVSLKVIAAQNPNDLIIWCESNCLNHYDEPHVGLYLKEVSDIGRGVFCS